MAYAGSTVPSEHGEFSGGGMIDPQRRADRLVGQEAGVQHMGEELWEVYATNPARSDEDLSEVAVPRVLKDGLP